MLGPCRVLPRLCRRPPLAVSFSSSGSFRRSPRPCDRGAQIPRLPTTNPRGGRFVHGSPALNGEVVQFHLSDIGEGIKEVRVKVEEERVAIDQLRTACCKGLVQLLQVTVKEWFVQIGDPVTQFDQICEVQSDKASVTITSRFDGVIKKLHYKVDEIAQTGDPLVDIEVEGEPQDVNVQENQVITIENTSLSSSSSSLKVNEGGSSKLPKRALATPAVRRMATEHNLSLHDIPGSGKDGRVMKEDVICFLGQVDTKAPAEKALPSQPPQKVPPVPPKAAIPKPRPPATADDDCEVPFDAFTRAMYRKMSESLQIPHFCYNDEVDMTALVRLRKELKLTEPKLQLSYLPFVLKAASLALLKYPRLNCSVDGEQEVLLFRASHNLSVAMDTPLGLTVPVVHQVQDLSVIQIADELTRLSELGKQGKLTKEDLQGGTLSLSNIGSIGGTYASPVIAPPEVAIGACGRIQRLPRFGDNDQVVEVHIMKVSWSADHRVLDGATVARFSNEWKRYLENPAAMLVHLK